MTVISFTHFELDRLGIGLDSSSKKQAPMEQDNVSDTDTTVRWFDLRSRKGVKIDISSSFTPQSSGSIGVHDWKQHWLFFSVRFFFLIGLCALHRYRPCSKSRQVTTPNLYMWCMSEVSSDLRVVSLRIHPANPSENLSCSSIVQTTCTSRAWLGCSSRLARYYADQGTEKKTMEINRSSTMEATTILAREQQRCPRLGDVLWRTAIYLSISQLLRNWNDRSFSERVWFVPAIASSAELLHCWWKVSEIA